MQPTCAAADDLEQPVGERQRQGAADDVVGPQSQRLRDRPGVVVDVAMREHHALGPAGGARGVDDGGEVAVDRARVARRATGGDGVVEGAVDGRPRRSAVGNAAGDAADPQAGLDGGAPVTLCGVRAGDGAEHPMEPAVADHVAHAAVAQDVGDLVVLAGRVDHGDDPARLEHAPQRDHLLDRVVEHDRHPVAAGEPGALQPGGERVAEPVDLAERVRLAPEDDRGVVGCRTGRADEVVVREPGHGCILRAHQ